MKHKPISILVYLILGLVIISTLISISNNSIYQDGEWVNAQWLGQDIVSLCLATPMLWWAQRQAVIRQQWRWKMILAGLLFYFVYTYTFFVFVAKLTFLYLFHLPIFALAVFALVMYLPELFSKNAPIQNTRKNVKGIIIFYLLFISAMLSFLWLSDIISHLTIPDHQSEFPGGEAPLVIYSLDLGIAIPIMIWAAIGYWRNTQAGYKLTGMILTKAATLGFALMAMSLSMYWHDLSPDTFLSGLWFLIGVIGTVLTIGYLRQLRQAGHG